MATRRIIDILQANLDQLVGPEKRFASPSALAKRSGVSLSTVQRNMQGNAVMRIDTLDEIAKASGLEAWQLLVDGFDVNAPPVLAGSDQVPAQWPFSAILSLEEFLALPADAQASIREYVEMKVRNNPANFRAKRTG